MVVRIYRFWGYSVLKDGRKRFNTGFLKKKEKKTPSPIHFQLQTLIKKKEHEQLDLGISIFASFYDFLV